MTSALVHALSRICGSEHVSRDGEPYGLGELVPSVAVRPGSEEEVSRILAFASDAGAAVVPWGGGTQQALVATPRQYDVALDLRCMDKVVAYEPGDMTITVQAGMRLDRLQATLAPQAQFLPFDPPHCEQATLGGMVASLQSGPLRCRFGSARDLVVGVRVAHADGTLTNAGSRVVKNATAYDVTKLYVGSFGTLGVFLGMTLRLHPRPEVHRGWVLTGEGLERLHGLANQLLGSHFSASRLELLMHGSACGLAADGPALAVSFAGVSDAVADQASTLARLAAESALDVREIVDANTWTQIRDFPHRSHDTLEACWRGGVLASDSAKALEAIRAAMPAEVSAAGAATVSHGILRGICRTTQAEKLVRAVEGARKAAEAIGGYFVLSDVPPSVSAKVNVWGTPPAEMSVFRGLKQAFDPKGILNPGRFLDL